MHVSMQVLIKRSISGRLYPETNTLATMLSKSPYASHPSFRNACTLLREFISIDPARRTTVAQALQHEYPHNIYIFQIVCIYCCLIITLNL